ncbi:hypothetical protein AB4Y89_16445 [Terriglobus sp. 2YAB30_2]|uniref:hypothetical protein n=1 Tax=Terriglobus sp. 2YAB30_2 TaxID=3233023 RepID=UPI003F987C95
MVFFRQGDGSTHLIQSTILNVASRGGHIISASRENHSTIQPFNHSTQGLPVEGFGTLLRDTAMQQRTYSKSPTIER